MAITTSVSLLVAALAEYDEEENAGGSIEGHRVLKIDRAAGEKLLLNDYFATPCLYDEDTFRRRFRMRGNLFNKIVDTLEANDQYFVQKVDACKNMGLSARQKCTAAIRQLGYGVTSDAFDEYLRILNQRHLSNGKILQSRHQLFWRAVFDESNKRRHERNPRFQ